MRNSTVAQTAGVSEPLDRFFEQVRTSNPFLANRVDRPLTEEMVDVFGIHEAEFRKIQNIGRQAHQESRGIGVALLGEAGVGKTHLLTRLGRWARDRQQAHFVYLHNFQADPDHAPAGLLRAILATLTNGGLAPQYRTPLFSLLNRVLRTALKAQGLEKSS